MGLAVGACFSGASYCQQKQDDKRRKGKKMQIKYLSKKLDEEKEQLTQEEVDALLNYYYSQIEIIHWYKYDMIIDSVVEKVNVYDAEVSVYKVTQKMLPFTSVIAEEGLEEYYCALGRSKYKILISAEYKNVL